MIYTNLLIFVAAIFLFSLDSAADPPGLSLVSSLALYGTSLAGYWLLVKRVFSHPRARSSEGYFAAEKKLTILALLFFSVVLFLGDIKFYLTFFSFNQFFPVLTNIAGLLMFFSYLVLVWLGGRASYEAVFDRHYSPASFVLSNIRFNLPIILPWIALSLMYDLLALIPSERLRELLDSTWGDLFFLGLFVLLLLILFPPLVRRLWNCRELQEGPLKDHLTAFCRQQNFEAHLYVWPLYEGRIITAGVLGLLPGLRYIILTPALMQNLNLGELEAVMAHEIGHVKYRHLLLYVLLIGGFSLTAGLLAEPILYLTLSSDWIFSLMANEILSPETVITLAGGLPLLLLLLLYFRYVFGFFIRNFERQADLYVFKVLGNGRQLISAFEKILITSGQKAETPNWHHFGIGERIAHLELCEREPSWISRQDRKIRRSLFTYVTLIAVTILLVDRLPADQLTRDYEYKYIETVVMPKLHGTGNEAAWYKLLGDLLFSRGLEDRALTAYHRSMRLDPVDPELLNNLAWLLLTSSDQNLRDPEKALTLALSAAELHPLPHVLDTLATAYWANGYIDKSIETERRALEKDSDQAPFYHLQLERFRTETYRDTTKFVN